MNEIFVVEILVKVLYLALRVKKHSFRPIFVENVPKKVCVIFFLVWDIYAKFERKLANCLQLILSVTLPVLQFCAKWIAAANIP